MAQLATTTVSSRGQVVIPKPLREELHLNKGDSLLIIKKGESLILKKLTLEDIAEETDQQYRRGETLSTEEVFKDLV